LVKDGFEEAFKYTQSTTTHRTNVGWLDLLSIFKVIIFDIWGEENDPTSYYYPSLKSHMDIELLNH
jgi:hypothetical protein